mmetsp:Transcript_14326/g.24375  ORF Transcript_14326/g.24375 Transcript_14326/m.24375 type:complete len:157 (+) Transcript_14326:470-940(+)
MNWLIAFSLGFCIGAVSPAVLVPSLMILQKKGYGVAKGIPSTLIAASSFDDIIAITVFGVLTTVSFEIVGEFKNSGPGPLILKNAIEIGAGLFLGLILGGSMIIFNSCRCISERAKMYLKFLLMLGMAVASPIVASATDFPESKYIGIIFFGYACN